MYDVEKKLFDVLPGTEYQEINNPLDRKLLITEINKSGLEDMFEYSSQEIFYRNLNMSPHKNIKDTANYLNELIRRKKEGYSGGLANYWFIRLKSSNKVIGTFGFVGFNRRENCVEIGKGLSPSVWGKGFVYELLGIMMTYAFNVLDLSYMFSFTQIGNVANIKSMERGGFKINKFIKDYEDGIGKKK